MQIYCKLRTFAFSSLLRNSVRRITTYHTMTDGQPTAKKSCTSNLNGVLGKPLGEWKSLENFVFKEILNSVPESKILSILCHNTVENKPAILILDKKPLPENVTDLNELITGIRLVRLSDNDIHLSADACLPEKFNVNKSTIIYPATEQHITKYRATPFHSIFETPEDYAKITLPCIQANLFSVEWIYNILDGRNDQDLILVRDDDPQKGFCLFQDLKWDGKTLENLYYQAIIRRRDIKSIRDLTEKELPLLENILEKSLKAIAKKHGLPASRLKCYFHYQPTYYHLHVHFRHIGSRSFAPYNFLQTVIGNLKLSGDYYQRATLQFVTREERPLWQAYKKAGRL